MPDVSSLTAQLKELQATLVRALQEEYYCDDLEPPDAAFGWSEDRLREFFESGGEAASAEQPAASGQAAKAPVTPGQPGGGRVQPELLVNPAFEAPPLASTLKELVGGSGVQKAEVYQDSVIAAGIPPLADGLFPPDDSLLKELSSQFKPYTKALATQTVGGGYAFRQVEAGWCVGSHAAAHGIDLRLFVARGKEPKLLGALRYSDGALIGRGFAGSSVHGGAVETALDEATAELAKSKLFPVATTVKIEFKIARPVRPQTTYRVECEMSKCWTENLKYDVAGAIKEVERDARTGKEVLLASCVATMANPAQIPGAGYD